MGYIGTSTLLKSLGISKKALYSLVNSGEVASPRKQGGRYLWSEQEATEIVCALARRSTQGALAFDQQEKRYLGGKAKYSSFIRETADAFCPGFESFADYFAGTGGSAEAFSDKTLLVNDLLYSSYLFLLAWYGPEWADMPKLSRWIGEYNRAVPAGENYVSEQFGGTYFGPAAARKIGFVREDIEQKYAAGEMNARERAILLASLLQAMDGAANIYAHYDTFKAPPVKWAPLEMRLPAVSNENDPENRVFQTDANMLAAYTYSDVAYLDPPVDSRQYGDIYHLPENIAQWAKPELRGKTKKVARAQGKSLYCKKGAAQVFAALVEGCKAKCILAALPEKQEGRGARSSLKLSAEEMLACLRKRGEVHIVFPPLPPKTPAEQQLLLSYEFKKKEENPRGEHQQKGRPFGVPVRDAAPGMGGFTHQFHGRKVPGAFFAAALFSSRHPAHVGCVFRRVQRRRKCAGAADRVRRPGRGSHGAVCGDAGGGRRLFWARWNGSFQNSPYRGRGKRDMNSMAWRRRQGWPM